MQSNSFKSAAMPLPHEKIARILRRLLRFIIIVHMSFAAMPRALEQCRDAARTCFTSNR
jgi:hypothetical protein